jgi:hypothetical protein
MIEVLEARALLADGISASPGPALSAVAGVPVTNAVFATFTVTDPTVPPGENWRALINFGDGHLDGPVIPIQQGHGFAFFDTHTYAKPGTYTVTIMIALPGSHQPNDNPVTMQVTVAGSAGSPMPTPTPTPSSSPPPPRLTATGLRFTARTERTFHGGVAHVGESRAGVQGVSAQIDWGDLSAPTPAQIRASGRGRFTVLGAHRYVAPGIYHLTIAIHDGAGRQITTSGRARVIK